MATHDYNIADQTTPLFRADLNNALSAIATNNSSATAPSTTFAGMWWLDTTDNYIKIRDVNDANWIIVAEFDVTNSRTKLVSNSLEAASAAGIDILDNTGSKIIDLAIASEATAKAGTNNTELMTPLRVKQAAAAPTGVIFPFAGPSAPTDFLLCYGQSVSTSTYADLFATIGYTYGGSGSSFNVPDLRGRVVAGQDDMGGTSANRLTGQTGGLNGDTLGGTGGAETHTLTEAQLPTHSHSMGENTRVQAGLDNGRAFSGTFTSSQNNSDNITYSTQNTGGDEAHNNVQPTIVLNYIIKT